MSKKTITLTYKLIPETKGFSVECLDWKSVYTQGENITECIKNAAEATELMLDDAIKGTLHKSQCPNIKSHKASLGTFQITFDLTTGKQVNIENIKTSKTFRTYEISNSKEFQHA